MRSLLAIAATLVLCFISPAARADGPAAPSSGRLIVLNDDSYLREFMVYKTPVQIDVAGKVSICLEPVAKDPKPLADFLSTLPPADWTGGEFNDRLWERTDAPVEASAGGATGRSHAARHNATRNSLICLRAKFVVEDPAKVGDLKLSLEYVGGVVVYLNGKELTRGHMPAGPIVHDTLAEKYPDDLYCEAEGKYLQDPTKNPDGFARRYRRLAGLVIAADGLRKGTNVLAIEIHRSPVNEAAVSATRVPVGGMYVVPGIWAYAGLKSIELSAATGSAVAPNIARPKGLQVWNCTAAQTVTAFDYGDPGEPLAPVEIDGLVNGVFSGRLVVSGDQSIKGLKVAVSDMQSSADKLASSAVRVTFAEPAVRKKTWVPEHRFDGLLATRPAEAAVYAAKPPRGDRLNERTNLSGGAVVPVWLTVRVPKGTAAGAYEGTVSVSADGLDVKVPLKLTVHGYALPDPKDMRIRNLGFESPENLARHFNVSLWSDRHFELLGKALSLMAEINSRQAIADLVCNFHGAGGNDESMVRWVKKGDGYTHDFTVLDKFLDTVAKAVGKPLPLRLNCWGEVKTNAWANCKTVSLLDPATGTITPLEQPAPGTPESVAFWKPVLDEVRKKVEARGWWDVTTLGHNSYCYAPSPLVVDTFKKIWPDGVYSYTAHNGVLGGKFDGSEKGVSIPIRFSECVWTEGRLLPRGYKAVIQERPLVWNSVARTRHREWYPLVVPREVLEEMVMRGHDGLGQIGVDFLPIAQGNKLFHISCGRGGLGPDCSTLAYLASGPDGPIESERFEMLREGTQIAQTILFLQAALDGKTLPAELAKRVDNALDYRGQAFVERWTAGRQDRDHELFTLAGEVAKATAK